MGLPLPLLRFLAREHSRSAFGASVLLLGRQCVYATFDQVHAMLRAEGIQPRTLPPDFSTKTNVVPWHHTPMERFTSDEAFFRLLGCSDVKAMDVSDFEGAEIVADLNRPVPNQLHDRFDLIVDSGTLEHVFDLAEGLRNVARMLKLDGRAVHFSPANNYTNHGFYQVCPTLYHDYYSANQFAEVRTFVAEQHSHRDPTASLSVYEMPAGHTEMLMSRRRLLTLAVATKGNSSTCERVPMQGYYATIHKTDGGQSGGSDERAGSRAGLKRWLPTGLKTAARRVVPGLDPNFKPWRLRFWGRLD